MWTKVLSWAWENRTEIGKKLADLFKWYRRKDGGILIIGPGGTGKTTLGRILAGEFDWLLDPPGAYEESIGIEHYQLRASPAVEVVVPPGQELRRKATWTDLLAGLGKGRFRGIILLSAYGYHSLGLDVDYRKHQLYQSSKAQFLEAYLRERRAEEVQIVQQLAPHLRVMPGKSWILTVVAKQDLWWPGHQQVESHYRAGEYGEAIRRILEGRDHGQVRHEFAFASLIISNFSTGKGQQLRKNTAGYDQRLHVESLRRLLETIDALKNWEEDR